MPKACLSNPELRLRLRRVKSKAHALQNKVKEAYKENMNKACNKEKALFIQNPELSRLL